MKRDVLQKDCEQGLQIKRTRHDSDDLAAAVFRGQGGAFGQGVAWHAGTPFRQEGKALLPPLFFAERVRSLRGMSDFLLCGRASNVRM